LRASVVLARFKLQNRGRGPLVPSHRSEIRMTPEPNPALRPRRFKLPGQDGELAALEMGPVDRQVDIVFSHGNGVNGRAYQSILALLADRFRILLVDLRGHGATTLAADVATHPGWMAFAQDLAQLVAQLGDAPVVMAGHSMGGTSSLLASALLGERVKALVMFDPVLPPPEALALLRPETAGERSSPVSTGALRRRSDFPDRAAMFAALKGRGAFANWSDAQLADYVEGGARESGEGVTLCCRPEWEAANYLTHNHDAWAALEGLTCPVRLIRADTVTPARADHLLDAMAAAGKLTLETAPGTTHFLTMERPELAADALAWSVGVDSATVDA